MDAVCGEPLHEQVAVEPGAQGENLRRLVGGEEMSASPEVKVALTSDPQVMSTGGK